MIVEPQDGRMVGAGFTLCSVSWGTLEKIDRWYTWLKGLENKSTWRKWYYWLAPCIHCVMKLSAACGEGKSEGHAEIWSPKCGCGEAVWGYAWHQAWPFLDCFTSEHVTRQLQLQSGTSIHSISEESFSLRLTSGFSDWEDCSCVRPSISLFETIRRHEILKVLKIKFLALIQVLYFIPLHPLSSFIQSLQGNPLRQSLAKSR